jgi:hypothetical protein
MAMVILLILIGIIIATIVYTVIIYNGLINLKHNIDKPGATSTCC